MPLLMRNNYAMLNTFDNHKLQYICKYAIFKHIYIYISVKIYTFTYFHKPQDFHICAHGLSVIFSSAFQQGNTVSYGHRQKFGQSEVNTNQKHGVVTIWTMRSFSKHSLHFKCKSLVKCCWWQVWTGSNSSAPQWCSPAKSFPDRQNICFMKRGDGCAHINHENIFCPASVWSAAFGSISSPFGKILCRELLPLSNLPALANCHRGRSAPSLSPQHLPDLLFS